MEAPTEEEEQQVGGRFSLREIPQGELESDEEEDDFLGKSLHPKSIEDNSAKAAEAIARSTAWIDEAAKKLEAVQLDG